MGFSGPLLPLSQLQMGPIGTHLSLILAGISRTGKLPMHKAKCRLEYFYRNHDRVMPEVETSVLILYTSLPLAIIN